MEEPQQEAKIQNATLESLAEYILENPARRVIVMTGAGVSTAAGIPDFRSPKTGLYANLQRYDLPYPEAIFELNYFYRRPEPFYALAREIMPSTAQFRPTLSHYFIRLLADKGRLLRNYTQNIDTLERAAGLAPELLVEAHGSFHTARCIGRRNPSPYAEPATSDDDDEIAIIPGCGREFELEWLRARVTAATAPGGSHHVPRCPDCDGLVKPDITFFGEALPARFHALAAEDFEKADVLVVMGTSLQVAPFRDLVHRVPPHVPRLLVNLARVGEAPARPPAPTTRGQGALAFPRVPPRGFDFSGSWSPVRRDVFFEGTTDDGVLALARLLGWEQDLLALHASGEASLVSRVPRDEPVVTETVDEVVEHVRAAMERSRLVRSDTSSSGGSRGSRASRRRDVPKRASPGRGSAGGASSEASTSESSTSSASS